MTVETLRLPRATHALADIHRLLPLARLILRVRYTRTSMIVIYCP